jgi:hypothetical protein
MGIQKQVFQSQWNGRQGRRRVMLNIDKLGIGVQPPKMSCSGVLDNDGFQAGVVKPKLAIGVCPPVVIVIILATADRDGSSIDVTCLK